MTSWIWVAAAVLIGGAATYLLVDRTDVATAPPLAGRFSPVTSTPGTELFPSLSPDGKVVAYASRHDDNWDISVMRVGGQRSSNLTSDSRDDDSQPAFSPDGERIAFRSEREGGGIFVMGATGENVRRLTSFGFNPAWTPDGRAVLFATEKVVAEPLARTPPSQLHSVDIDAGRTSLIYGGDAVQPSASPNGERIAYWGLRDTGPRDIWTIPTTGGEPVEVANHPSIDWNPVWSTDGRCIIFTSDRGGSMNLWRVTVDQSTGEVEGGPQPFTTPSNWSSHASFSAAVGTQLVYSSAVSTQNIYQIAFDALSGEVRGRPVPVTRGSSMVTSPHASPDGEWLTVQTWQSPEDIYVVRADGTGRRQFTQDPYRDRRPQWSPRGDRIAFYSNRTGKHEIWTVRVDGSGLRQHTDTDVGTAANFPVWSPDGARLAFWNRHLDFNRIIDPDVSWDEQTPIDLPEWRDERGRHLSVSSWSPDGTMIAGGLREQGGQLAQGIAVYNVRTHRYRALSDVGLYPVWLNDSRHLIFHTEQEVLLIDSESGDTTSLLTAELAVFSAVGTSADNRHVFFALQGMEADIWMHEPEETH